MLEWLPSRGVSLSDFGRLVIGRIFLATHQHRPLSDTVRCLGAASERKARDRFRREGMPSPHEWRRLAEALHALRRLQRETDSLFSQATDFGYSDAASLGHHVAGVFGATPRVTRRTIGRESWAYAWLQSRRAKGEPARHH